MLNRNRPKTKCSGGNKGNQFVEKGDSITFTIKADDGYKIAWIRIDNTKIMNKKYVKILLDMILFFLIFNAF